MLLISSLGKNRSRPTSFLKEKSDHHQKSNTTQRLFSKCDQYNIQIRSLENKIIIAFCGAIAHASVRGCVELRKRCMTSNMIVQTEVALQKNLVCV